MPLTEPMTHRRYRTVGSFLRRPESAKWVNSIKDGKNTAVDENISPRSEKGAESLRYAHSVKDYLQNAYCLDVFQYFLLPCFVFKNMSDCKPIHIDSFGKPPHLSVYFFIRSTRAQTVQFCKCLIKSRMCLGGWGLDVKSSPCIAKFSIKYNQ